MTAHLQTVLPHCDLIVGTEEEWHIAGGTTDTIAALQAARGLTGATLVCKRGPLGCVVFEGGIEAGTAVASPVREIEVFNVLGAGDGSWPGSCQGGCAGSRRPNARSMRISAGRWLSRVTAVRPHTLRRPSSAT